MRRVARRAAISLLLLLSLAGERSILGGGVGLRWRQTVQVPKLPLPGNHMYLRSSWCLCSVLNTRGYYQGYS